MKRIIIPITVAFALFCVCGEAGAEDRPETVEGITPENYPRVDGSTSTEPLNTLIACKLLGWQYEWRPFLAGNGVWQLLPRGETMPEDFFGNRVKTSQTHNAFLNLIDGGADIVLSARKMSDEERAYAESADVEVIETPVALDALDFLVNSQNPVRSLTAAQVRDIYLRNLVNWREAGGADGDIRPFIRNPQSGSQEMMKEIVMNRAGMPDWEAGFDDDVLPTMALVYREVADNLHGICFTPHYYREYIIRDAVGADRTKTVAIEGVYPDARSIGDKTYPFVAPVYAVVRADADRLSMTGRLYDWLRTEAGKAVIAESGYVPTEA
ncbi:MAG: substrate-binding domain-containing protein, partial [Tannerella sp.]|nr:substrate-binding domain-containing protein [Tannerella sp.]